MRHDCDGSKECLRNGGCAVGVTVARAAGVTVARAVGVTVGRAVGVTVGRGKASR